MIFHGVEIAIPGGAGEIVRAYFLVGFLFLFYYLYHVFIVTVQELACSAIYGVNKTSISKNQNINEIIKPAANCVKYSTHRQHTANK